MLSSFDCRLRLTMYFTKVQATRLFFSRRRFHLWQRSIWSRSVFFASLFGRPFGPSLSFTYSFFPFFFSFSLFPFSLFPFALFPFAPPSKASLSGQPSEQKVTGQKGLPTNTPLATGRPWKVGGYLYVEWFSAALGSYLAHIAYRPSVFCGSVPLFRVWPVPCQAVLVLVFDPPPGPCRLRIGPCSDDLPRLHFVFL